MNLADRVKNIVLSPKAEWPAIDAEAATTQSIFTGYVMILAAIGPVLAIVMSLGSATLLAVGQYAIALAMTFALAFIADALSPSFGGSRDFVRSLKLVAYSWTAVWVIAGIAAIIPLIGALLMIAALIYSCYTFNLGAPLLGRSSREKAIGYTIVVILCGIVLGAVVGRLLMPLVFGAPMFGMGRMWI